MSALQAIPTQHGLDILNSELKSTVTKYQCMGALTHDAPSESQYSFYENTIETSYYDDNGVLTFILNLPIEMHFNEYLYQIKVLDDNDQAVVICDTPKIGLAQGIGGMVTLKVAITGSAGEVVFKSSDYVTETELRENWQASESEAGLMRFATQEEVSFGASSEVAVTPEQLHDAFKAVRDISVIGSGAVEPAQQLIIPLPTDTFSLRVLTGQLEGGYINTELLNENQNKIAQNVGVVAEGSLFLLCPSDARLIRLTNNDTKRHVLNINCATVVDNYWSRK
ncbi:hypothetical protein [Vibrio sp. 10N.261.46.A3]|uniref:hypothetical protein n=1 Tax=Vibrio sp. 10N.261.46.A3 TaxID=3229658 RepID=UPI003552B592